jgi:glycosyltransferase involved in cell wall biosynthesis
LISFIAAVYNEEKEITDLHNHIYWLVDNMYIVDDGSTDDTENILAAIEEFDPNFEYKRIAHTGLPEMVKAEALDMVPDGSWVIMLDADERFMDDVLQAIHDFCNSSESEEYDYVYFRQVEIIDGTPVREFSKCKLFRKEAMQFPENNIHADDVLTGRGLYKEDWIVLHRKTTDKQIAREIEYLATYKKLLADGKIDEGRYQWLIGLHHYVKPH